MRTLCRAAGGLARRLAGSQAACSSAAPAACAAALHTSAAAPPAAAAAAADASSSSSSSSSGSARGWHAAFAALLGLAGSAAVAQAESEHLPPPDAEVKVRRQPPLPAQGYRLHCRRRCTSASSPLRNPTPHRAGLLAHAPGAAAPLLLQVREAHPRAVAAREGGPQRAGCSRPSLPRSAEAGGRACGPPACSGQGRGCAQRLRCAEHRRRRQQLASGARARACRRCCARRHGGRKATTQAAAPLRPPPTLQVFEYFASIHDKKVFSMTAGDMMRRWVRWVARWACAACAASTTRRGSRQQAPAGLRTCKPATAGPARQPLQATQLPSRRSSDSRRRQASRCLPCSPPLHMFAAWYLCTRLRARRWCGQAACRASPAPRSTTARWVGGWVGGWVWRRSPAARGCGKPWPDDGNRVLDESPRPNSPPTSVSFPARQTSELDRVVVRVPASCPTRPPFTSIPPLCT